MKHPSEPPEKPDGVDGSLDGEFVGFRRALTEDSIPGPNALWMPDIARFALAFDGYQALGDRIGDLANAAKNEWSENGVLPQGLIELRSCLFFEQRRYRHFGSDPDEADMPYIHALVEAIRAHASSAGSGRDDLFDEILAEWIEVEE